MNLPKWPQGEASWFAACLSVKSGHVHGSVILVGLGWASLLEKARRLEPGDSETLYELARANQKEGRNREVWQAARAAARANSQNRRVYVLFGQLARENGKELLAGQEFAVPKSISKAESNPGYFPIRGAQPKGP